MSFKHWVVVPILFLLIPTVLSYDFNFVANYTLDSFQTRDRVKCFQNASDYWFCSYLKASDKKSYIETFTPSFVSLGSKSLSCFDASGGLYQDCNYETTVNDGAVIDCLCQEDDGNPGAESLRFFIKNNTFSVLEHQVYQATYNWYFPSVMNDYILANDISLKSWYKTNTDSSPKYTATDNLHGDGTLTLLPGLTGYPTDMQLAYCNGKYHLLNVNSTSKHLVDNVFGLDYVAVSSQNVKSDYNLTENNWNVWVDNANDIMYLASVYNVGSYPTIDFDVFSCDSSGHITLLDYQTYNQSDFESDANATSSHYMTKPFLMRDTDTLFKLFYEYRSGSSYSIKVSVEGTDCSSCGSWIPQSECQLQKQKYIRNCPTGTICTNTTYWADSSYCGANYNESLGIYQQNYEYYSKDYSCTFDNNANPPAQFDCTFKENIPSNCQNTNVTIVASPFWNDAGIGCNEGNWTLRVCNPDKTSSCDTQVRSCIDLNHTLSRTYTDYVAGTDATGSSMMKVDSVCNCYLLFDKWIPVGIKSYHLESTFHVECEIPYVNKWICDEQKQYSKYQQIDGTFTNETYCSSGCNEDTGRCYGSIIENKEEPTSISFWIKNIFHPNATAKIVMSFFGSLVIGGIVSGFATAGLKLTETKDSIVPFIVGVGFGIIIFTIIGWLPIFILIVIILFGLGGIALKGLG